MILADIDIKKALETKEIIIKPLPNLEVALSASAIDLRLSYEFEVFEHTRLPFFDPRRPSDEQKFTKRITLKSPDEYFILQPGEFALASTLEWIELPDNIAARLEGRSSLGRVGIVVHSTAALIHPGMRGRIVLELGNHARMPVALYPEMRVCSISFEQLTQKAALPYHKHPHSKYAGQEGVTATKITEEY